MKRLLCIFLSLVTAYGIEKKIPPNSGRVCGFGDFNNDRFTDIIVQRGANLTVLLYDDSIINVLEEGKFNNATTFVAGDSVVECSLGDFNGDARLDVLVSERTAAGYKHSLWLAKGVGDSIDKFEKTELETLKSQAMAVDIDGDGRHDIFGFYENGSIYCQMIQTLGETILWMDCADNFSQSPENPVTIYPDIPHLYTDVLGDDLYAEIVVMTKDENGNLKIRIYQRIKDQKWREINAVPPLEAKYVGAPVPGDFNADRKMELLVPVCLEEACEHISYFAVWQRESGWRNVTVDLGGNPIVRDPNSKVLFRVGDFTLDGYPDLLVTLQKAGGKARESKIVENLACTHCEGNDTRKFEVRKASFIQPKEVALGELSMSAFFDLKEDGSLDVLVEYVYDNELKFTFIPCDEKGDTTFLKVQVFTSCGQSERCPSNGKQPGTGISWGGSCMSFTMSDGWGGSLQSAACQQPAQTYRSLMAPYVLFGLGRSPNFVDELSVGAPKYNDRLTSPQRLHVQKQIVPNSRIIMMPPGANNNAWSSRLYVTPSTLILQSLVVISVVCVILLVVVFILHWRERKEDRIERQQQSHRFHFDAM